jgi:hypothetical protein
MSRIKRVKETEGRAGTYPEWPVSPSTPPSGGQQVECCQTGRAPRGTTIKRCNPFVLCKLIF